jgi:hypothetical protein
VGFHLSTLAGGGKGRNLDKPPISHQSDKVQSSSQVKRVQRGGTSDPAQRAKKVLCVHRNGQAGIEAWLSKIRVQVVIAYGLRKLTTIRFSEVYVGTIRLSNTARIRKQAQSP